MAKGNKVIYNGELVSRDQVLISPFQSSLMYGDGCFETIKSYKGKFLHLEQHLERLNRAMNYFEFDRDDFEEEEIRSHIQELLNENGYEKKTSRIRIQVWREGEAGKIFKGKTPVSFTIEVSDINTKAKHMKLCSTSHSVISDESLNRSYKLSNYMNNMLAGHEAREKGFDGGIMLTTDNVISEVHHSNIFWFKGEQFYTPSMNCDILPGITRSIVVHLLGDRLVQGRFVWDHILDAEAVFVTNSIKEFVIVDQIDDITYQSDNENVLDLRDAFDHYKATHIK